LSFERGARGTEERRAEDARPERPVFKDHEVHLIGTPRQSLEAGGAAPRPDGIEAHIF